MCKNHQEWGEGMSITVRNGMRGCYWPSIIGRGDV